MKGESPPPSRSVLDSSCLLFLPLLVKTQLGNEGGKVYESMSDELDQFWDYECRT